MVFGSKILLPCLIFFLSLWLTLRFLLPIALPFLFGGLLALGAEPLVRWMEKHLRLPRGLCTGIGVSLCFILVFTALAGLFSLLIRQLSRISGILPQLFETAGAGASLLEEKLLSLASGAPAGIRPGLTGTIRDFFSGGTAFLQKGAVWLLELGGGLLTQLPDQAFRLLTALISGFMISAQLPVIQEKLQKLLQKEQLRTAAAVLGRVRRAAGKWLLAQLRLCLITMAILLAGLLLLKIPHAPVWAFFVALLDALPLLGTGTVLIPWSLICLLQGQKLRALGQLAAYIAAALTRSLLEPRLVGKQLGLDPLVTLAALYAGYRLWGFGGMVLSPLITVILVQLLESPEKA